MGLRNVQSKDARVRTGRKGRRRRNSHISTCLPSTATAPGLAIERKEKHELRLEEARRPNAAEHPRSNVDSDRTPSSTTDVPRLSTLN
jgi:hypothetical protein